MQLKSLDICGFKSFPDRIQLTFDPGITAVVGPNGSGKSNIADAVRWVLGEQSGKTLRSGKMEDVIFSGTQQRKAMGYAAVTLVIDNGDRFLPVEADEVAVGRKLYRSGESEYRVNGAAVRLRDVNELFMDTGLGRDGYSIIGQGRIAEIVGAKSAQRREIFEEAAGISKYRYRKEQAEKRLEAAQDNLVRLHDILSELEGRVAPLRDQARRAQEYLRLAEQKRILEISLWLLTVDRSRDLLREQEDKLILAQNDHESLQSELGEIEKNIAGVYDAVAQRNVEMERLRGETERLRREAARGAEQKAVWNNDISHNEETAVRLQATIETASSSREQIASQLAQSAERLGELERQAGELGIREREAQDALLAAQRERGDALQRQTAHTQERAALARQIADERLRMATSATMLEQLAIQLRTLEAQARQAEAARAQYEDQLGDVARLLRSIDEETENQQNVRRGYEMKLQAAVQSLRAREASRAQLDAQRREHEQKAKLIEDMEKHMEGYQQSVRFIMNRQRSGNLRGIEGPVSQLISVDAAYAPAIEVALAGAMQNIVVTTDTAAKVAIEALKSARAGRATFLPLSVVRPRPLEERGLESCEGFVAVAADLVRCEEKYRGIVGNLLGRIAVAQDMDSALAIARQYRYRFKIVTLDGQVVNPGGSMTGGSTIQNAGLLSRAGEIARLRGEAAICARRCEKLDGEIREGAEERARIEAQIAAVDADLRTMADDRIRYEAEQKRLCMALEELARQRAEGERQAGEVERKRAQLGAQSGSSDEVLGGLLALEEQCVSALGQALRDADAAEERAARLGEALESLHLDLLAREKDGDTIRQLSAQLQSQLDAQSDQAEDLRRQMEELRAQNEDIRARIARAEEEVAAAEASCARCAAAAARLEEEKTSLEQKATTERQRERELHARAELLARELAKLEERKMTIQSEYDAIVARLYDEYELTLSQAAEVRVPILDTHEANRELTVLKGKIKELGSINLAAIEEYREVNERYTFMKEQIGDAERSREELRRLIGELTGQMRDLFSASFSAINEHFGVIFTELFGGGSARLLLDDPENVLETGIEIYVQPPGKIIRNLAALSGGEQAFVAIAIYFAILKVRPSPFCLLDEIEAALDDVNVVRFAQYLRRLCGRTQFIAITHRRGTMEEADVLYGVTMQEEGVSKLLRLGIGEIESQLGKL